MTDFTPEQIERFWSRVDRSGGPDSCWLWRAGRTPEGYGKHKVNGRAWRAHRLVWVLVNGPIPAGMEVCHDCPGGDNPSCVNPAHLWLGTRLQNAGDMVAKGRSARGDRHRTRLYPERNHRGELHGSARLTQAQVDEIRALHRPGEYGSRRLSRRFGVSMSTIHRILSRQSWKPIDPESSR
jgi:hypothetical protein